MELKEKLDFFRELVSCNDLLYSWCYDEKGTLLYGNAPEDAPYHSIFLGNKATQAIFEHLRDYKAPLTISIHMGLMWGIAFERTSSDTRVHVLGPVFTAESSLKNLQNALHPWEERTNMSLAQKYTLLSQLEALPVLSYVDLCRYVLMLHYCLAGEKLHLSDIIAHSMARPQTWRLAPKDRHRTWMAEQALMRMIREGDLNYKEAMSQAISLGTNGSYRGGPLEQSKISEIIFISLCTRAAIEGGLSPDTAYSLGDSYIQSVQDCTNTSETSSIGQAMYKDFVHRVYEIRTAPQLSPEVKSCRDYVMMHVEEPLTLEALAARMGYTPYYFARKFKKEMHCSLRDYIKFSKMERAKVLLETTDLKVEEIAARLHLCSRTYFTDHFRAVAGCSPAEYRRRKKRV